MSNREELKSDVPLKPLLWKKRTSYGAEHGATEPNWQRLIQLIQQNCIPNDEYNVLNEMLNVARNLLEDPKKHSKLNTNDERIQKYILNQTGGRQFLSNIGFNLGFNQDLNNDNVVICEIVDRSIVATAVHVLNQKLIELNIRNSLNKKNKDDTFSLFDDIKDTEEESEALFDDDIIIKKIRGIGHIKSYLQHFLPPNVSMWNASVYFIFGPSAILINMAFIIYSFIEVILKKDEDEDIIYHQTWLKIDRTVVTYVEFIGLMILFMIIIVSYVLNYKCLAIDAIKYCRSWSSFSIFYQFRPRTLFNYYQMAYQHHKSRLNTTNVKKYKKCKLLRHKLCKEISQINPQNDNKFNQKQQALQQLDKIIGEFEQSADFGLFLIYRETLWTKTTRIGARIIFLLMTVACLGFGIASLLAKLAQLSYINNKLPNQWSFQEYFRFIAFCNQLWNICDIDSIAIHAIYKFIFMQQNGKYTRFITNRISMYDAIIKQTLCNTFGFRGLLIAISIDCNFLHKLTIQDSADDLTVPDLIKCLPENEEDSNDFNGEYIDRVLLKQKNKQMDENDNLFPSPEVLKHKLLIPQSESVKSTHIKFKLFTNIHHLRLKIQNILNVFKMYRYQQPSTTYMKTKSIILRYIQKKSCNQQQALYNHIKGYFSVIKPQENEIVESIVIKTNVSLLSIFEFLEKIINWILMLMGLPLFATFIVGIIVLILESNDALLNECYVMNVFSFYVFCITQVITTPFVFVSLYLSLTDIKKSTETFLSFMLVLMVGLGTISWWIVSLLFLVHNIENRNNGDCFGEIIEYKHVLFSVFITFNMISFSIATFLMFIFVVSFCFSLSFLYILLYILVFVPAMLSFVIWIVFMPFCMIIELIIIGTMLNESELLSIAFSLGIVYFGLSILCCYLRRKCRIIMKIYSIIYGMNMVSVYVKYIIYLILNHSGINVGIFIVILSMYIIVSLPVMLIYIAIKVHITEEILNVTFFCNWSEYWKLLIWILCMKIRDNEINMFEHIRTNTQLFRLSDEELIVLNFFARNCNCLR